MFKWMNKEPEEFFDYAPIIINMEKALQSAHKACLRKDYGKVPPVVDELVEQAILLKRWIKAQR
jgi:hypothetical protein